MRGRRKNLASSNSKSRNKSSAAAIPSAYSCIIGVLVKSIVGEKGFAVIAIYWPQMEKERRKLKPLRF